MKVDVKFNTEEIKGLKHTLGTKAAERVQKQISVDIGEGTETMAEQAYDNAPVDTGALRSSILASVQKDGKMVYVFGSHLPYAQYQEYNHVPYGAYFRKAIWQEQSEIADKIGLTVKSKLNG